MVHIGNDWDVILKDEFNSDYYKRLREFLKAEFFIFFKVCFKKGGEGGIALYFSVIINHFCNRDFLSDDNKHILGSRYGGV